MDKLDSLRNAATALLLATAAAAAPAQAPRAAAGPQPSAEEQPIVVTGARLSPREARARAVAFVQGTGVASGDRPVARWVDPICISVIGISERHAAIVAERLKRIAAAAGIPIARPNCENNLAVVFTTDASQTVQEVERRAPRRLEEVTGPTRTRLVWGSAPVRWWYTTQPRSRHGMRANTNSAGVSAGEGGGGEGTSGTTGGSGLPGDAPTLYHYNSSIVSTQSVRALISASVIVDVNAMERMPLEAVAAYVAMVAFAEIRENDFSSPGSIMGMFAADPSAPRAMTEWDMAFLRALYRLPLDRDARRHRGILVRELLAEVEAGS